MTKKEAYKQLEEAEQAVIKQLMNVELCKSGFEHEMQFGSVHEAESVIREELEEAEEEMQKCRKSFERLHASLRDGDECGMLIFAEELQTKAVRCAGELLQLGAMCKKGWTSKWKEEKYRG